MSCAYPINFQTAVPLTQWETVVRECFYAEIYSQYATHLSDEEIDSILETEAFNINLEKCVSDMMDYLMMDYLSNGEHCSLVYGDTFREVIYEIFGDLCAL
jgi:hypothetical protein